MLAAAMLVGWLPAQIQAKSYSSGGGHSYSSHSSSSSSHSSSSGGSHSFSSGSHSFSSGSSGSSTHSSGGGSSTHTYSSGGSSSHSPSSGSTSTRSSGGSSSSGSSGSSSRPSSSSASSSSSGSKSFTSGSGKSYSSKPSGSDSDRHSYTSGKSYSSGSSYDFVTGAAKSAEIGRKESASKAKADSASSSFTYDTAASQAKKQEVSKSEFTRFKESQSPKPPIQTDVPRSAAPANSYSGKPPPIPVSSGGSYRGRSYIPDTVTIRTRPVRVYNVFNPYYTRPLVIYRDPYDSFFWWWLLDRSLDDRAWWAYHHRYDMDPARYEALMERDQQLEQRVAELETQQVPRDPAYTPAGIDRDLMYSDNYVAQSYNDRPTRGGAIAFWIFAAPTAFAVLAFFIWLIWFKRWQPATATAT